MSTSDNDDVPELFDESKENKVEADNQDDTKVPITIVTGYLGSGKSTLLNYVATQREKKIAIIMNEFGDSADIERSLTVQDGDNTQYEEWLELDNGCLCCTVKDSGVSAIEKLMDKKGKFDYILLETTGVADPAPIANMFWLDDALAASIYLDGVVTVMDATTIEKNLDDVDEEHNKDGTTTAHIQIAHADILLLNKCDKVENVSKVKKRVESINSLASIVETSYSKVDLNKILDLRAYQDKIVDIDNLVDHGWHDHRISTVVAPFRSINDEEIKKLESWLQHVLWEGDIDGTKVEIQRTKGKIVHKGDNKVYVIQGVCETYELVSTDAVESDKSNMSKLVLIGKHLDKTLVQNSINNILH